MFKKISKISLLATLLLLPSFASASLLSLSTASTSIAVGDQIRVDAYLDTRGAKINAAEGNILFPADLLVPKEIISGNSAFGPWIKQPQIINDKIIFSGIIPGGINDDKVSLFSVIFQAKAEGLASIKYSQVKVLLSDGQATPDKIEWTNLPLNITRQNRVPDIYSFRDTLPPEPFAPEVIMDPNLFNGQWFLIFNAADKQSGIDHYEVREGRGNFIMAESPYLLKNQELDADIVVKAVDRSLNERVVILSAPIHPQPPYLSFAVIIGVILIFVFLIKKKLYNLLIRPKSNSKSI